MDNLNTANHNDDDYRNQLEEDVHHEDELSKQNATEEQQAFEKQKARRRLIGAFALVVLAVVIIPFVFDSTPRSASPDLVMVTQGKENVIKGQVKEESTPPAQTASENSQPQNNEQVAAQPTQEVATAEQSNKESVNKEQVVAQAEKPVAPQETQKPQAEPEKVPQAKAETPKPVKKNDDPLGQMIAEKTSKKSIQVAALGTEQKANELKTKLTRAGFKVQSQKIKLANGQQRIRIRVGPYKNVKEVEKACAKLKAMNLSCTVVN